MTGYKRNYRSREQDHRRDEFSGRRSAGVPAARRAPGIRPIVWMAVLAGLIVWSAVAWVGYVSVDGLLGWAAANAGVAVDSGKDIATALGVGKEQVGALDALNVSGFLGQALALLKFFSKPAIVVLWGIGALVLLTAPLILSKIGRIFAARRH